MRSHRKGGSRGVGVKARLRMKCRSCGHWNRVPGDKVFIQQTSPIDPDNVKVMVPMYEPLELAKCKTCGKTIAEPKELIRIVKTPKRFENE